MGYRHYFYQVENDLLNKLENSDKDKLVQIGKDLKIIDEPESEESYIPLHKIGKEVFGFGKHYENAAEIEKLGKPLFRNTELSERYEDYGAYIVGKEAVLSAIRWQQNKIINYYEEMLFVTDEDRLANNLDRRTKEEVMRDHLREMWTEWSGKIQLSDGKFIELREGGFAINTNDECPTLTNSWKYEYSIFELVRIYKHTDWNKYSLIFMGW